MGASLKSQYISSTAQAGSPVKVAPLMPFYVYNTVDDDSTAGANFAAGSAFGSTIAVPRTSGYFSFAVGRTSAIDIADSYAATTVSKYEAINDALAGTQTLTDAGSVLAVTLMTNLTSGLAASSSSNLLDLSSTVLGGATWTGNAINAGNGADTFKVNSEMVIFPVQRATASAPTYVEGGMYYDTTLQKMRIGGAAGWQTITSV